MFDEKESMIYNLALRVIRYYLIEKKDELKFNENNDFISKTDLEEKLNFRKKHIECLEEKNKYFEKKGDNYYFLENLITLFNEIKVKYEKNKDSDKEAEFKSLFPKLKNIVFGHSGDGEFENIIKQMYPQIEELHWKYLPVFSDEMIYNRRCTAESDLKDFYFHFHPIEDLVEWIEGKRDIITSKYGDINLEQEISVSIYSQRWKSSDVYQISRTTKGWKVNFMMTGGSGNEEGESILNCLKHDSISYPKNIKYQFSGLWNEADNTNMSIEELGKKMKRIFKWINIIEISKPDIYEYNDRIDQFYLVAKETIGDFNENE